MLTCEQVRAALSARLDGEAPGLADDIIDAHVASCPECSRFYDQASVIQATFDGPRQGREPREIDSGFVTPDLADSILAEIEPRWRQAAASRAVGLAFARVVLGVLAILFVVWAVAILGKSAAVFPVSVAGQTLPDRADPVLGDLVMEAAAIRMALALGLGTVAWRPQLAGGLAPMVGALWTFSTGFAVRGIVLGTTSIPQVLYLIALGISVAALGLTWYFGPSGRIWQRSWRALGSSPLS